MINFREIFNSSYSFIGILLISLLVMIILLINRNIKYSVKVIGNTFLVSGIITLGLDFLLSLFLKMVLTSYYKVIIEVITNNVLKECFYYSIVSIGLGLALKGILKFLVPKVG